MFDFSYFGIVKVQMFSLCSSFFLYSIPINIIRIEVKHAPCLNRMLHTIVFLFSHCLYVV